MTESETKRIATAAAKEALQDFMLLLGVDVSTGPAVVELQKDFHHIRATRKAVNGVRNKAIDVLTGSAVTGLIGAVAFYFMHVK